MAEAWFNVLTMCRGGILVYGRFRTGDNKPWPEKVATDQVLALEKVARLLEEILKAIKEPK